MRYRYSTLLFSVLLAANTAQAMTYDCLFTVYQGPIPLAGLELKTQTAGAITNATLAHVVLEVKKKRDGRVVRTREIIMTGTFQADPNPEQSRVHARIEEVTTTYRRRQRTYRETLSVVSGRGNFDLTSISESRMVRGDCRHRP